MELSKRFKWTAVCAALAFFVVEAVFAGPVTIPHTFSSGTAAVAAEVNANFSAVRTAVNDNDGRIAALENAASGLRTIVGHVKRDGTILSGTGFTVRKDTGSYTIEWDQMFTTAPFVIGVTDESGGTILTSYFPQGSEPYYSTYVIFEIANKDFRFIAIGE
ncbi:MAG: hypothetical protein ACYTGN_09125 [Planctomycetota bacterium]|jgi:hypothetical protein